MSNERIRGSCPDTDVPERLELLEKLFQRVQQAASEAAAACGQYAVQADDAPYTGPALPRREAFQVVMRNDPAAGTFVKRLSWPRIRNSATTRQRPSRVSWTLTSLCTDAGP